MTTNTKENTSVLENLDFDVSCNDCEKIATWIGIATCCKTNFLFCKTCKIKTENSHIKGRTEIGYRCKTCKSHDLDIDWKTL